MDKKRVEVILYSKNGSELTISSDTDILINTRTMSISQLGEGEVIVGSFHHEEVSSDESQKTITWYNTGELKYRGSSEVIQHNLYKPVGRLNIQVEHKLHGEWVKESFRRPPSFHVYPLTVAVPTHGYDAYQLNREAPNLNKFLIYLESEWFEDCIIDGYFQVINHPTKVYRVIVVEK